MTHHRRARAAQALATRATATLALATLALAACSGGGGSVADRGSDPARVEQVDGGQSRIRLTDEAAKRLDIQTAPVIAEGVPAARLAPGQPGDAQRTVVAFAAVLYAPDGSAFTYTNPEPLVFGREAITIDYIEADKAVVSKGPATGTPVVTVGAAELFGIESGIGDE